MMGDKRRKSIIGPLVDDAIDEIAASYVINYNDMGALNHQVDRIQDQYGEEYDLPERLKLKGIVEEYLKSNYTHLPSPSALR